LSNFQASDHLFYQTPSSATELQFLQQQSKPNHGSPGKGRASLDAVSGSGKASKLEVEERGLREGDVFPLRLVSCLIALIFCLCLCLRDLRSVAEQSFASDLKLEHQGIALFSQKCLNAGP